jgi:predicted RNA-binding Zn-ribbon protein involved in translation (DUF1610 family)
MTQDALKLAFEAHCKNERHHTVAETRYWCNQYKLVAQAAIEALAERAMQEVQRLGQEIEQEPLAVYGYCPQCGAKGVMRERRPNGNDKCANGHTYPSSTSTPPQRKENT